MSPKRGDRAAPPPVGDEFDLRFANTEAANGWDHLSRHAAGWKGQTLEGWQYEVTGGGRIWYLVDDANRTAWITYAGTGHPKATD